MHMFAKCALNLYHSTFFSGFTFGFDKFSDLNTRPILVCYISNEREQIPDQIYILLWVEIIPWELLFLHTVEIS